MAAKRAECSTLAAFLFLAASAFGQARVDLLIAGGTVVAMDDDYRVLEGGALAIDGSRIVAVLERGALFPRAVETLDATGMLVIHGLVNTHGHVPMALLRGLADDMNADVRRLLPPGLRHQGRSRENGSGRWPGRRPRSKDHHARRASGPVESPRDPEADPGELELTTS